MLCNYDTFHFSPKWDRWCILIVKQPLKALNISWYGMTVCLQIGLNINNNSKALSGTNISLGFNISSKERLNKSTSFVDVHNFKKAIKKKKKKKIFENVHKCKKAKVTFIPCLHKQKLSSNSLCYFNDDQGLVIDYSYNPCTLRTCCSQSELTILKICKSSACALFLYNCTPNTLRTCERSVVKL